MGRRGRLRPAAATLLSALSLGAALGCAGCGPSSSSGPQPVRSAGGSQAAGRTPTPLVTAAPGWREVPAGEALRRALERGVVGLSRQMAITPWALAGDGRSFFGSVYSKEYSGVARIDTRTGRISRIRRFADAVNDQADGSFDGRWLVWHEYHSLEDGFSDFTVYAWDSRSGRVRRIGAAERSASRGFWPSSWREADVRQGFAAWEQGSGPDSRGDVHVVELAEGRDRVVRRGHPGDAFMLADGMVVWTESPRRGAVAVVRAADARTGRRLPTPRALRAVPGVAGLATDGRALAFSNGTWLSVWWAPSPEAAPERLFTTTSDGEHVGNSLEAAGRWVCFDVAPHTYIADTATRRYMELPLPLGGWTLIDGQSLIVVPASSSAAKAVQGVNDIIVVPVSVLEEAFAAE